MALQDDENLIYVPPNWLIDDMIDIACLFDDCPIQSTYVLGELPILTSPLRGILLLSFTVEWLRSS
ncbi:conserved hypothetical protein [Ricinus communis]|uniref:Uncharacterized protein n=1 Tax=Ricinus communis TaxID=3988 RepID=B9S926_RICCO|nr:conserved hypothetical protein [Ricinus communis]